MAFIVPAVLGGLALAVMAIVSVLANRKKRRGHTSMSAAAQQRILIHAINDDRCTGCDACVAVCPTNVLDLIDNKSRVLRFQDCIQCEACMWACPTDALVMFPEGSAPPPVRVPDIDDVFQTRIPGQYLIGEVAGKPLIKNAANLGRAVVEHMRQTGLAASGGGGNDVDVLIVGSGPGGLSAALTCQQRGLSYVVIEKEGIISSTVSRYPKGKLVMAEPYDSPNLSLLPIFDSTKEEMVSMWKQLVNDLDVHIKMHETVQMVQKQQDGSFAVHTNGGQYRAQRVVLATGTRGKPRDLGVPGENQPKVVSLLEDPDDHHGQAVCVVGGGDSALEAAVALAEANAKVIMSYRGRSFHRAAAKNRQKIDAMVQAGRIKVVFQSEIIEFGPETVTLQTMDGTQKRYPNQAAFVLIGADPPIKWLGSLGIHYVERPHMAPMPASHDLVRRFLPDAPECPENVEDCVALTSGRQPAKRQAAGSAAPPPKASAGRRFIRSASSLFKLRDEPSNAGPMPLSEFARRSRHGSRHEGAPRQRDQLDAGERTRILRMLRDEGGRRADEDSKLNFVEDVEPRERSVHRGAPSRPPLPSPLATLDGPQPRQAVIVGLAKATANAPASRRKSRARPMEVHEENTQHLPFHEAQELMRRASDASSNAIDTSAQEEPTNFVDFDPVAMMREAEQAGASSRRPSRKAQGGIHDEATRNIDVDSLVPTDLVPELTADDMTPVPGDNTGRFEEKTRVAGSDIAPRTLSEVDWDLD